MLSLCIEHTQDVAGVPGPTVWELPVADVLQVGPRVLAHVLGGGDGALLQLHLPPVKLGTLSGGDAARHGASHR